MHDHDTEVDYEFLSRKVIYLKDQLDRLSKNGRLTLSAECTQNLLRDLGYVYRLSHEFEQNYRALERSHERLAKITGIYDVVSPAAKRRSAFAVVGGTDAEKEAQSDG